MSRTLVLVHGLGHGLGAMYHRRPETNVHSALHTCMEFTRLDLTPPQMTPGRHAGAPMLCAHLRTPYLNVGGTGVPSGSSLDAGPGRAGLGWVPIRRAQSAATWLSPFAYRG